jgi:AcrR family transcriptional regulator
LAGGAGGGAPRGISSGCAGASLYSTTSAGEDVRQMVRAKRKTSQRARTASASPVSKRAMVAASAASAAAPRSGRAKRGSKPPVKRRVRLETDERRAQLLALARQVFTERAYDDVSIDDIAAAAAISKGLLYHYFPTKRDLYVAALREISNELVASVNAAIDDNQPPAERVRAALDAYLEHVLAVGRSFVALMRGGIGSDPEVAAVVEATRQAFVDQFLTRSPLTAMYTTDPMVRLALRGWIGMVEATSIEWVSQPAVPRAKVRDMLVQNLLTVLGSVRGAIPLR